jgi:arsenite-transporting ATPase
MLEIDLILDRKLLLVTGKGGIGKSFVSACIAQYAAGLGKSVLIIQSAGCDQITSYFSPLSDVNIPDSSVSQKMRYPGGVESINLSAEDNFREYVVKYLGQKMLYDTVFSNKVVKTFIKTIPGFSEVMLLGRMYFTCELAQPPSKYDLVIFDGYASGHFLSLMTTPDAVINSTLGGPLVKETTRVKNFLAEGKNSGIVFVTTPEDLVVSETLDFLPKLQATAPSPIVGLIVNKVLAVVPEASANKADNFIHERKGKTISAMQELKQGLAGLQVQGLDMPIFSIKEYPVINMPLEKDFAKKAFDNELLKKFWK